MCQCERSRLTFETLFTDPLIRLVMASDGVTREELAEVLEIARSAQAAPALPMHSVATSARVIPFPVPVSELPPVMHA
jgi:hypothetical protein